MVSFLLTLNIFSKLIFCFQCWLWKGICWLGRISPICVYWERRFLLNVLLKRGRYDKINLHLFLTKKLNDINKTSSINANLKKVNSFLPTVSFHKETIHLICTANQMTGFYMKCSTGLWNGLVPAFGWAWTIMGRYLRQNKLYAFF